MNSGMNRLGYRPAVFRAAWERAASAPSIGKITLMMHFANADEGEVDWQLDQFDATTAGIPGERSTSNSAAVCGIRARTATGCGPARSCTVRRRRVRRGLSPTRR